VAASHLCALLFCLPPTTQFVFPLTVSSHPFIISKNLVLKPLFASCLHARAILAHSKTNLKLKFQPNQNLRFSVVLWFSSPFHISFLLSFAFVRSIVCTWLCLSDESERADYPDVRIVFGAKPRPHTGFLCCFVFRLFSRVYCVSMGFGAIFFLVSIRFGLNSLSCDVLLHRSFCGAALLHPCVCVASVLHVTLVCQLLLFCFWCRVSFYSALYLVTFGSSVACFF